ncbi:protein-tyrosine phosphatase [Akanthomyces lecanii RCEF 1005]|uniref:Protein-tyrosine phosphatase n=1 Tax=Akanthomyces lecanii RCEF 1005 TaxID=1081108 RepID=A0A168GJ93_CORDF|nr:protein-tyrosine phosphatase [Akanthomyces lecanii RCEF 1005]
MLLGNALLALAWAATAVHAAPANGYEDMTSAAGTVIVDAEKGGLQEFQFVRDHMSPGDVLARSSSPYYDGNDSDQKITPETIEIFKKYGITHVISANHEANNEAIKKALADAGIAYTPLPVEDFHAATAEDFQQGWEAFVRHRGTGGTLLWCGAGFGRTGTMISALQMYAQHERGHLGTWTHADYERNHVEEPVQEEALNALQERLRAQPLPATTEEETTSLLAGNFDQLNCVAILATLLSRMHISERSMFRDVATLSRRQATPAPNQFDCERARHILQTRNVPKPCRKIKNIQLGVAFANHYYSGSYDDIGATLEGQAGKATLHVATQPYWGSHHWAKVDMQASFQKDEIDVTGIDKITLNAAGIFNPPFYIGGNVYNDKWQVQDIQIRADCADPDFEAKDDKLVGLNAWYGHPGGWFTAKLETKTVATFPIVPGDWAFSPPCATIKELAYEFRVTNRYWGGTWDALAFTLGESKNIDLGENVDPGCITTGTINLKDAFGKDDVDIRDLKVLNMIDNYGSSGGNGDAWAFEGMQPPALFYF